MDPEFNKKKFDEMFKNMSFSFTRIPMPNNFFPKHETVDQVMARLDSVDETVDAMTSYPTAKRMLDELFSGKD